MSMARMLGGGGQRGLAWAWEDPHLGCGAKPRVTGAGVFAPVLVTMRCWLSLRRLVFEPYDYYIRV